MPGYMACLSRKSNILNMIRGLLVSLEIGEAKCRPIQRPLPSRSVV